MPDTPVRLDLDAIEARLAAATPGPWEVNDSDAPDLWVQQTSGERFVVCDFADDCVANAEPDADLIAHVPTDLAALIAEVRRLRQALEHIASYDLTRMRSGVNVAVLQEIAREALSALETPEEA